MKEVNGERVEGLSFVETRAKTLRLCYFYLHNVDTWSLPDNGPTADPMPIRAASSDMPARIASASSVGRKSTAPACLSLDMPGHRSTGDLGSVGSKAQRTRYDGPKQDGYTRRRGWHKAEVYRRKDGGSKD